MERFIDFHFTSDDIIARAQLLDDKAPKTCDLVWSNLPITGYFHHAYYSGAEVVMILPKYYELGQENATTAVLPWEILFASLRASDYFEIDQDFSEIAFFL